MAESDIRSKLVKLLAPLDPVSVENYAYPGTPDLNITTGWIELKWVRDWPAGAETAVKVEHFTPQQRVWIARRAHRGGRVWVVLVVAGEWLFFEGATALCVGKSTRAGLLGTCDWWEKQTPSAEELIEYFTCVKK